MKIINKILRLTGIAFVVIMGFFLAACEINIGTNGGGGGQQQSGQLPDFNPGHTIRATVVPTVRSIDIGGRTIPVPTKNNGLIDSYTDGESNFFLIEVGTVRDAHISTLAEAPHLGATTRFRIESVDETFLKESSSRTITRSVYTTNTRSATHEANVRGSILATKGVITAALSGSWRGEWTRENANATENREALQTSQVRIEQVTRTFEFEKTLDHTIPHGHYRLAYYADKRIFFIVQTTLDNSRLVGNIRPITVIQTARRSFTFCETGRFDYNAPVQKLYLEYGFYSYLPIPDNVRVPPQSTRHEFTSNDSFIFEGPVPATIAIYARGAGGGGQGGHRSTFTTILGVFGRETFDGAGGGGGGGAIAYMTLEVNQPVQPIIFGINVGRGGSGGAAMVRDVGEYWRSGIRGVDGDATTVTWAGNTLTVAGGKGGGEGRPPGTGNRTGHDTDRRIVIGGSGGELSDRPLFTVDWATNRGERGGDGAPYGSEASSGGRAGYINPFGIGQGIPPDTGAGGSGGVGNRSGHPGADGFVVIVVTHNP